MNLFRKTVLAGIGATVVTSEKVESVLNDLVDRGRITTDEAKESARRIVEEGRKEYESTQKEMEDLFNDLLKRASVASRRDLAGIEERLRRIEAHLDMPAPEPSAPAGGEAPSGPGHDAPQS